MANENPDEAAIQRVAAELERGRRAVSARSAETTASSRRAASQRAEWLQQRAISARSRHAG